METQISHLPVEIIAFDNIVLRAVQPEYFSAFKKVVENDRDHIGKWMPWARGDIEQESKKYFDDAPSKRASDEEFTYSIFIDEQLVGAVGIHKREETKTIVELGYWLSSIATGKGVMTFAVQKVVDTIFELTSAPSIEIGCDKGNAKSAAIPQRLGFTLVREIMIEDELHPSGCGLYFALTREEWEAQKISQ